MKTYSPKQDEIERSWYVVDAKNQVLGRLASHVARILRGKHKPIFAPHVDVGDHVIIINAAKARVTGAKMDQKTYYRHSGYPGGLHEISYRRMTEKFPERAMQLAIKGMLRQQCSAAVSESAHLGKGSFLNSLKGRYQQHAHEYEQQ